MSGIGNKAKDGKKDGKSIEVAIWTAPPELLTRRVSDCPSASPRVMCGKYFIRR